MAMKARYTVVDGEVIAEKRNGVRRQYVPDPLGSTVALLDNTQAQTDTFAYWPSGEEVIRTGTTATPFRFVGTWGYYRDSNAKTYVRAREMDNQKGRWLTEDPLGLQGGDANLYRYALVNPLSTYDFFGTQNIVIGHPDPGAHIIGDDLADTFCNKAKNNPDGTPNKWSGTCYTLIAPGHCYAACLDAHEGQHRYDLKKCCKALGKCLNHSSTLAQRNECIEAYNIWVNSNRNWIECQAHRNELECEQQMMRDRACSSNPTDPCCQQLNSRQRELTDPQNGLIPKFCGGRVWPRISHTNCHFPR